MRNGGGTYVRNKLFQIRSLPRVYEDWNKDYALDTSNIVFTTLFQRFVLFDPGDNRQERTDCIYIHTRMEKQMYVEILCKWYMSNYTDFYQM